MYSGPIYGVKRAPGRVTNKTLEDDYKQIDVLLKRFGGGDKEGRW